MVLATPLLLWHALRPSTLTCAIEKPTHPPTEAPSNFHDAPVRCPQTPYTKQLLSAAECCCCTALRVPTCPHCTPSLVAAQVTQPCRCTALRNPPAQPSVPAAHGFRPWALLSASGQQPAAHPGSPGPMRAAWPAPAGHTGRQALLALSLRGVNTTGATCHVPKAWAAPLRLGHSAHCSVRTRLSCSLLQRADPASSCSLLQHTDPASSCSLLQHADPASACCASALVLPRDQGIHVTNTPIQTCLQSRA